MKKICIFFILLFALAVTNKKVEAKRGLVIRCSGDKTQVCATIHHGGTDHTIYMYGDSVYLIFV